MSNWFKKLFGCKCRCNSSCHCSGDKKCECDKNCECEKDADSAVKTGCCHSGCCQSEKTEQTK